MATPSYPLSTSPHRQSVGGARRAQLLPLVRGALVRVLLQLPRRVQRRLAGPPVEVDGAVLDVEVQLLLRMRELSGDTPIEDLPVQQGRPALRASSRLVGGSQPVASVHDFTVPGPAGELPVRHYVPTADSDPAPTLLFFHGGGWVYGDLDSHDATCRFLCERGGVRVLTVDYRLAPEHRFPAAVEDALAAFRWVVTSPERVGADVERLVVGGDSAGGNLAAVVALLARDEPQLPAPAGQLLIYPAVDLTIRRESRDLFGDGFFLSNRFIDQTRRAYLPDPADRRDPRASPLLADLRGVAPAHVVTAGFDPLRDEGRAYADALRAAEVDVTYQCEQGLIHSFANTLATGSGREAMTRVAVALRELLSR